MPTSNGMMRLSTALAAGAALAAAPGVAEFALGENAVSYTGHTHFVAVGFSALVASTAAVGLTVVGARRGDTRTMLVGTRPSSRRS
jgi:hypothetical protein